MKRVVGGLCACLLLAGGGCGFNVGNTRVEADVRIDEKTVDATLEQAAAKVHGELRKRGLQVTVTPSGDTARVVSKTRTGDQFTVVLRRVRTASGKEQTSVRVEWGTRPDRELWLGLLVVLGASVAQGT